MDNGWKPSSDGPKSMEGCGLDLSGSRGRERSEKVGGNRRFDDLGGSINVICFAIVRRSGTNSRLCMKWYLFCTTEKCWINSMEDNRQ
jgi:hypothetical protein